MANESDWVDVQPAEETNDWVDVSEKLPATKANFPTMGVARPKSPSLGQEVLSAVPLYGSPTAFREGREAGIDLLGNNILGQSLGALAGTGRAIGTIFNPLAKGLGYTAPVAQAVGSIAALDPQQAIRDLTGQTEVLPNLEEGQTANTLENFLINSYNAVRRDPTNTIPMIAGGVQLARAPRATVSNIATGIEKLGSAASRGMTRFQEAVTPTPESVNNARSVRKAFKPKTAQLGNRVENAAAAELNDIYSINPEAVNIDIPVEGFGKSVSDLKSRVQTQLNDIRSRSGNELNGGDQLAVFLDKKADAMKRTGRLPEDIKDVRAQADALRGNATTFNDLQATVTDANWARSPFFQKQLAMQDPMKAGVSKIINDIIAEEGGKILNKEIESVGGQEAAGLRKKWSNLKILEDHANETVNKIINSAPPEASGIIAGVLSSQTGVAGLYGLVNGWASGVIPIAAKGIQIWAKNAEKSLKNPNDLITKVYDNLRKANTPYSLKPPVIPPPIQQAPSVIPTPTRFNYNVPPQEIPMIETPSGLQSALEQLVGRQSVARPELANYPNLSTAEQLLIKNALERQILESTAYY